MKTERTLKESLKGLGRNKVRTFLMMLGIIIGITTLTIIVSAILGAKSGVMGKLQSSVWIRSASTRSGKDHRGPPRHSGNHLKAGRCECDSVRGKEYKSVVSPVEHAGVAHQIPEWKYRVNNYSYHTEWAEVWDTAAAAGEFINEEDVSSIARVAVIVRRRPRSSLPVKTLSESRSASASFLSP